MSSAFSQILAMFADRVLQSGLMKLTQLTVAQRKELATKAETSDATLRNIQHGRRQASAEFAIRLEKGARKMGLDVRRESLCAACRGCELARVARKAGLD